MHKSILILKQIYIAQSNTPNMNFNHLITPRKPPACSNTTTHHKINHKHHNYNAYKYWNQIKYYSSHLINNTHLHLQEMKNTLNMYLNHLITLCMPPACFNTTTHHKTNHKHHNYNAYKYLNQIQYYSSNLINKTHSHLQEMKNTPNMYLNHLKIPCKPPAYFNTTTYHKTHHQYTIYNAYKYWKHLQYFHHM